MTEITKGIRGAWVNPSGAGDARPSDPDMGQEFFDTDLDRPIWWDGARWVFYDGKPAPTYYVDSVGGDDLNDGRSQSSPLATLAAAEAVAADSTTIALARGGKWRETLDLSALTSAAVVAWGTGEPPVVDGSDVVDSWTVHGTHANVYEASVAHDSSGSSRLRVFEDDEELTRVDDAATCQSTPGSFVDVRGSDASPVTVQIHPTDSADPTSNGSIYEVTVRNDCIRLGDNAHMSGGVQVQRAISNNGALVVGEDADVSAVLSVDGTKHSMFVNEGAVADLCFMDSDDTTSDEPSNSFLVFFESGDISAHTALAERAFFGSGVPGTRVDNNVVTLHGSTPTDKYLSAILRGGAAVDTKNTNMGAAKTLTMQGWYIRNTLIAAPDWARTVILSHLLFDQIATLFQPVQATDAASVTASLRHSAFHVPFVSGSTDIIRLVLDGDYTIENCSIYVPPGDTRMMIVGRGALGLSSGSITVNNCILSGNSFKTIEVPAGVDYFGDNNVFYAPGGILNLVYHGTTYTTLADWQAATGQDANSVVITSSPWAGDPSTGDFTTDSTGFTAAEAAAIDAAGAREYWDYNNHVARTGAPAAWPTVPETRTDARAYVGSPESWEF